MNSQSVKPHRKPQSEGGSCERTNALFGRAALNGRDITYYARGTKLEMYFELGHLEAYMYVLWVTLMPGEEILH